MKNFHVTRNLGVDAMHDILEGVARYDVSLVLDYFINKQKYFTIEELNLRIRGFDYGPDASVNKPIQIYESHIKNRYIILSSSEMHCLLNTLNLIIGHKVPQNDKVWDLYLMLKNITNIVFSSNIHQDTHLYLGVIIEEYLLSLNTLFSNSMKPKHHFLIHYKRRMQKFGPLGKISCLRNEAKHKEGKKISGSTTSRLNINRTVAIKYQLMQNYRFINKISNNASCTFSKPKDVMINSIPNYNKFLPMLPKLIKDTLTTIKWLEIDGKKVNDNMIIVLFTEDGSDFYFVSTIILQDNEFFLLCKRYKDVFFNRHFSAYQIYDCNIVDYHIFKKTDIENCIITYVTLLPNGYYFIPKCW